MMNKQIKTAICWSGGKDSCFACYKAIKMGYKIDYLFNLVSNQSPHQVSFHSIPGDLVQLQAKATNFKLFQKEIIFRLQNRKKLLPVYPAKKEK